MRGRDGQNAERIVHDCYRFWDECQRHRRGYNSVGVVERWIKYNVDAAVSDLEGGIDVVQRDHDGRFPIDGLTNSEVLEAIGIRKVLNWIKNRRNSRVIIECDYQSVVSWSNSAKNQLSPAYLIIKNRRNSKVWTCGVMIYLLLRIFRLTVEDNLTMST